MKKNIFLAAVACCICICASAFDTKKISKPFVNARMEQSLANQFGPLAQAEWNKGKNNTVEASLEVEGQRVHAFFSEDGEYICSTMPVTKESLPLLLRQAMVKKLANVGISTIMQTHTHDEISYFFLGTDAKGVKVWKGRANGSIEFVQKL